MKEIEVKITSAGGCTDAIQLTVKALNRFSISALAAAKKCNSLSKILSKGRFFKKPLNSRLPRKTKDKFIKLLKRKGLLKTPYSVKMSNRGIARLYNMVKRGNEFLKRPPVPQMFLDDMLEESRMTNKRFRELCQHPINFRAPYEKIFINGTA